MYTLTTMVEFSSAHTLVGHSGPCKKMHGHNWKVEVEITGEKLDKIGMVVDFKEIRKATNLVVDELDHEFLNNLEPFSEDNPCLLYTSPSPRDLSTSRMPSSA